MRRWFWFLFIVVLGVLVLYGFVETNWSYSTGERAGWIQKFSRKGWVCKTWEGEMAMVTMPGTVPEKFAFTVWDERVVEQINRSMGQRVSLSYEQKKGLPSSCFGETEYWITGLHVLPDVPPAPGAVPFSTPVPSPAPGAVPAPAPVQPAPDAVPAPAPIQPAPGAVPAPAPIQPAPGAVPAPTPVPSPAPSQQAK